MPKTQTEKKSPKDMKTKTALKSSITKAFKEFGDSDHPKDEFKKALSEELNVEFADGEDYGAMAKAYNKAIIEEGNTHYVSLSYLEKGFTGLNEKYDLKFE